jgi:DNA-binding winged helix-turn-helix (wHTH) protein
MPPRADPAPLVRFSVFEVDLRSGKLRKSGVRVPLQDQPLEILKAVLERPGDLVTRDELRQRLWRHDTFVDFEDGLNAAIRRLREALGDNATTPRFIETLPRRGYRFIAPLPADAAPVASAPVETTQPLPSSAVAAIAASLRKMWPWALTAVLIVMVGVVVWQYVRTTAPLQQSTSRFSLATQPLAVHAPSPVVALSPDGTHLAYVAGDTGAGQLYLRKLSSLEARPIAGAERVYGSFFSPDGQGLPSSTKEGCRKSLSSAARL